MAKGGNQGERPRHWEVGQTGEYNKGIIAGQIHPGGIVMDDDGTNT